MSLKLWYSPASPFVRKVMVFAHETGLADSIELVSGDVWAADSAITKDNPLGKVPALVTPDGVFAGSYLCCEYLDSLHAGARLIPSDPRERWPALQLHAFADGIIEAAVASVVEQLRRPKEFVYQGMVDRQHAKINRTLDKIASMALPQAPGIAAITLGRINNMLNMLSVSAYLQGTVKGLVISAAVFIQRGQSPKGGRA